MLDEIRHVTTYCTLLYSKKNPQKLLITINKTIMYHREAILSMCAKIINRIYFSSFCDVGDEECDIRICGERGGGDRKITGTALI